LGLEGRGGVGKLFEERVDGLGLVGLAAVEGLGRHRSQDLRAVAAAALYRSEPDESEAIDALLEVLPDTAAAFEAQRGAARKAGITVILWEAFVDLASDG